VSYLPQRVVGCIGTLDDESCLLHSGDKWLEKSTLCGLPPASNQLVAAILDGVNSGFGMRMSATLVFDTGPTAFLLHI